MKLSFTVVPSLSYGEQFSRNMLIEGDNQTILAELPVGSIDFILTDPPYATGKLFRYDDRWKTPRTHPGEEAYVTEAEVGRHANWINFMACRLQLMKSLLKETGIIAICIGKEQLFRLGILMDEFFGEHNRLGILCWQKRFSPANDSKHISDTTDYVLIYAKKRSQEQEYPAKQTGSLLFGSTAEPLENWGGSHTFHWPAFLVQHSIWSFNCCGANNSRGSIRKVHVVQECKMTRSGRPLCAECHYGKWVSTTPRQMTAQTAHQASTSRTLVSTHMGHGPRCTLRMEVVLTGHDRSSMSMLRFMQSVASHAHRARERGRFVNDYFARTLTAERLRRVLSGEWATGLHAPLPGGFTFYSTKENWHSRRCKYDDTFTS